MASSEKPLKTLKLLEGGEGEIREPKMPEVLRALLDIFGREYMPEVIPTPALKSECYANALIFVTVNRKWDVVHGIPMGGPTLNERIGHAWNEIDHNGDRWVYDPTGAVLIPAALYYHAGQIEYTKTYTMLEAAAKACKSGQPGPWDKKIKKAVHIK